MSEEGAGKGSRDPIHHLQGPFPGGRRPPPSPRDGKRGGEPGGSRRGPRGATRLGGGAKGELHRGPLPLPETPHLYGWGLSPTSTGNPRTGVGAEGGPPAPSPAPGGTAEVLLPPPRTPLMAAQAAHRPVALPAPPAQPWPPLALGRRGRSPPPLPSPPPRPPSHLPFWGRGGGSSGGPGGGGGGGGGGGDLRPPPPPPALGAPGGGSGSSSMAGRSVRQVPGGEAAEAAARG